jgi:hypothetical protein
VLEGSGDDSHELQMVSQRLSRYMLRSEFGGLNSSFGLALRGAYSDRRSQQ